MPTFDTMSSSEAADALEALNAVLDCQPLTALLSDTTMAELTNLRVTGQAAIGHHVQQLGSFVDLALIWASDETVDWSVFFLPDGYD